MKQPPMDGQELAYVDFDEAPPTGQYTRPSVTTDIDKANLLTSRVSPTYGVPFPEERHKVVIDLAIPAQLIASSTPGHSHLLIDHEMDWDTYVLLLDTLVTCGLVEPGYVRASKDRGYTAVRLPWVKKRVSSDEF